MPTKVLALELSETLTPLWADAEYDSFWILVRYRHQPIGWVWVSILNSSLPIVSVEQLRQEILSQLGSWLPHRIIGEDFSSITKIKQPLEPISVVVCVNNNCEQLQRCLEAIISSDYPNYEVIVVDNSPSSNRIAERIEHLPVRYVHESMVGLSQARNRGVAEALHNIVAFTQSNICVDSRWLYAIHDAFSESDAAAITGFTAPAELETTAQFLYEFDYNKSKLGDNLRKQIVRRSTLTESDLIKGRYGTCSNVAFRRNLLTEIGLFNTTLDIDVMTSDASDMEMLHRLISQGHTLIYDPCVLGWHIHHRHFSLLYQQVFNKASSLGCYLLASWQNHSIQQALIWKLLINEWFNNWILRNIVRPPRKLPRHIALIELAGMLTSPFIYISGLNNAVPLKSMKEMGVEEVEL